MKLNYKKIGDASPAVLILHGVFGSLDNWMTLGRQIAGHGFSVYLIDQRNHGRSPHADPLDYASMAADLKEFITDHQLESPLLIGHSMGGKTVMQYTVSWPDTVGKLVVVDISPRAYPLHHQQLLKGMNGMQLDAIQNRQEADALMTAFEPSPGVRQFLMKNLYRDEDGHFAWRFNLPVLTRDMPALGKAIAASGPVPVPALFIRGGESDYLPDSGWDAVKSIFPKATLETIPGAGHWVHAEQPALFLEAVLPFLQHTQAP